MRKRILSLVLAIVLAMGALSGVCLISASAETSEKINLLENYRLNPHFSDEIYSGTQPYNPSGSTFVLAEGDTPDGDGLYGLMTKRTEAHSARAELADLFYAQGEGATYEGSFFVKAADANQTNKIYATRQFIYGRSYSQANIDKGLTVGVWGQMSAWYFDAQGNKINISVNDPVTISNQWVEIHFTIPAVELTKDNLELNSAYIYFAEKDPQTYTESEKTYNEGNICIDNFSLYRTDKDPVLSGYPEEIDVKTTDNSTLRRYKRTAIGAIYYSNWYTTPSESNEFGYNYWEETNSQLNTNKHNSAQEARSLSLADYHFMSPFWSKVTNGTADVVNGATSHIEFVYDEDTWQKEMAYAYYAGINYMAYLGSTRGAFSGDPINWHIKNEGKLKYTYNGSEFIENTPGQEPVMQMCVMLQDSNQDIPLYISIMDEDYYYKIDGSPVMYFFDSGVTTSTVGEMVHDQIAYVRKKAALAGINDVYMIQTGTTSANATSIVNGDTTNNGLGNANAISWYTFDASSTGQTFSSYKTAALNSIKTVINYTIAENYGSVIPTFSLGRYQKPRIDTPVTWISKWGTPAKPYGGRYTKEPTAAEITAGLLDVLNYNKQNYSTFKANNVLMFAWNEFTEGGWICPTYGDGSAPNTSHLEAVKSAIDIYRTSEQYTLLTTDVNGTLTNSSGTVIDPATTEMRPYMLSPKKAVVASKTPYSISFAENEEGLAYSLVKSDATGANLGAAKPQQISGTFTGLTPGAYYAAYAQATANSYEYFEGCYAATISDPVQTYSTIQTAPVIESFTASTITVAKENWEGYEYSLDNVTYQASNVFTGLNPSTSYTVYARVPGTTTALSADATTKAKTTPGAPGAPVISEMSTTSVTLEAKTGYEYSLNGNTWVSTNEFVNLTPGTTYSFYQRIAETAEENASPASAKTTVTLSKNTVTMQVEPVAQQVNYNSVTLVAIEGAEYSKDGQNWQTSNEFTGLQEGTTYTFYQRFKETATADASNITQAQIQTKLGHLITITVDTTGEIDFEQLSTITVNGNTLDVTFVDGKASFIISRDALVSLSFVADAEYKPVSIRNAGTKGAALGIDSYTFIAYGNRSDYVVKYVLTEDTTIVNMFYTNAAGEKVVFDSFIAESDLILKLQNYPQLYNKTFKKYIVDGNEISTANEVAQLIETQYGTEVDVEVVYSDNAATTVTGYSIAQYANMEVTVEDQPVQGNVAPLSLVTFTASETATEGAFSYWADEEGNAVSYNRVYTRYITGNVDIHPVYGAEVQQAAITVKVADNEGKLVLIAERSLKSGLDILEHGIIIAEYETDKLSLDDVGENAKGKVYLGRRIDNNGSVLNNGTYILTKGDKHSLGGTYSEMGTTLSFVAYVRYNDANGQEQIVKTRVQHSKVNAVEPGPSLDFDEID